MKTWLIVLLTSLFAANVTYGANEGGNGGVGVVCRNQAGQIVVGGAELLDIFEGRNEKRPGDRLRYQSRPIDLDTQIELAQTKMFANADFLQAFQEELAKVRSNIVFLPHGVGLEPTPDAFPIINKKGCKFENIATYAADGNVYVDQEIYDALNVLNKAALYVHEAIYAVARRPGVGDTNSIRSRKLTAQVLASNGKPQVIQILMAELTSPPLPTQPVWSPSQELQKLVDRGGRLFYGPSDKVCNYRLIRFSNEELVFVITGHGSNKRCSEEGSSIRYRFSSVYTQGHWFTSDVVLDSAIGKMVSFGIMITTHTAASGGFLRQQYSGDGYDYCEHWFGNRE